MRGVLYCTEKKEEKTEEHKTKGTSPEDGYSLRPKMVLWSKVNLWRLVMPFIVLKGGNTSVFTVGATMAT